jgi:serine/threonine protein kinase
MGCVYRAEHTKLGREVALKVLRADYARRKDAVARFFQEARSVNRIRHRNIVDITDLVELEEGIVFIIMELLDGVSLTQLMRTTGAVDTTRALVLMVQICDGLSAAHSVGIVHRDLKPDNIIVAKDQNEQDLVKVLDFGVAKLLDQDPDDDIGLKTQAGSVIGTPAYMSPEQAGGLQVDGRADIYSLGAIMYEIFTGQPLFRAKSFGEYVRMHLNEKPTPPRNTRGGAELDSRIEEVILKCLEKSPDSRFHTAENLRTELLALLAAVETSGEYTKQLTEAHQALEPTGAAVPVVRDDAPAQPYAPQGSPPPASSPNVVVRPSAAMPLVVPDSGANIPQFYQVTPSREQSNPMLYGGAQPTPMPYGTHPTPMPYGPGMQAPMGYGPPTPLPPVGIPDAGMMHGARIRQQPYRRNPRLFIALLVGLAAVGALLIFLLVRRATGPSVAEGVEAVTEVPPSADIKSPAANEEPVAVVTIDAGAGKPPEVGAAPEATPPKPIVIEVETTPLGDIYPVKGSSPDASRFTSLCRTPCPLTIKPNDGGDLRVRTYVVRADGFEDYEFTVNLDEPLGRIKRDLVSLKKPEQPKGTTAAKRTRKNSTGSRTGSKRTKKSTDGSRTGSSKKKPCKASAGDTVNPFDRDPCK